ncbi:MAG: molecular chaperone TorD family protein [Pelovirga sp.]
MMTTDLSVDRQLYQHFAHLFHYPDGATGSVAAACRELLRPSSPTAADQLEEFSAAITASGSRRLEELYTATFELQPQCYPYVGYQLCGESQQRIFFLMKLNEIYRQEDFRSGGELPDHLAELLRYLGTTRDPQRRDEIVDDALLPAVDKLLGALAQEEHPYRRLLTALRLFLGATREEKGVLS